MNCKLIILYITYCAFCPNSNALVPFFVKPINVFGGIELQEILGLALIPFYLFKPVIYPKNLHSHTLAYCFLCFYSITIAIATGYYYDLLESFRTFLCSLITITAFKLFISSDSSQKIYLYNCICVGAILGILSNIYCSIKYPHESFGGIFMLHGQNGPTSRLAFLILIMHQVSSHVFKGKKILVYITFLITIPCYTIMSYSKLGAFLIIFAFVPVVYKYIVNFKLMSPKYKLISLVAFLLLFIFAGSRIAENLNVFYNYKLKENDAIIYSTQKDASRIHYLYLTYEAFIDNPAGTGFSGIAQAFYKNNKFLSFGHDIDKNDQNYNPHNTILYYTTALGLFGLVISINLVILKYKLCSYNTSKISRLGFFLVFVLYVSTIPYLFSDFYISLLIGLQCAVLFTQKSLKTGLIRSMYIYDKKEN